MELKIRKATSNDVKGILSLIRELAKFERASEEVEITEEDLIRDGFGKDPLFECILAIDQDEILGMALFYYRYSTWKGKTIHLEDLIVKESLRGKGIGQRLFYELILIAKIQQVRRLEWAVLEWNKVAISFYEKAGAKVLADWRVVQMNQEAIRNYLN